MLELRFHGRGGQGAVTSAELLALAAIGEGRFAQAFPSFGPERRGAPVVAFARISESQIRNRTAVTTPNVVIVLDASLLKIVNVAEGLEEGGTLILNTSHSLGEVRKEFGFNCRLARVDANAVARKTIGRVITNTAMLGVLLKALGLVDKEHLEQAVLDRFGIIGAKNVKALQQAYDETEVLEEVGK